MPNVWRHSGDGEISQSVLANPELARLLACDPGKLKAIEETLKNVFGGMPCFVEPET